jgi:hypothetical protein
LGTGKWNVETTFSGAYVRSDVWQVTSSLTASPSYLGYIQVDADGTAFFQAAGTAVPEPATFGILAGVGLLMVSVRRQLKGQKA